MTVKQQKMSIDIQYSAALSFQNKSSKQLKLLERHGDSSVELLVF